MHRRWGRTQVSVRHFGRLLRHSTCWIALDRAGAAIALASVGPVSSEPGVVDLGLQVADAHQRQGIGTALARHAGAHAQRHGAHTLSVYTEASNHPMRRLLRRLGPSTERPAGTHLDVRIPLATPAGRPRTLPDPLAPTAPPPV
ncbi:GNAT family N-acetyltransferase [Streptomyces sp. NPDC093225]|uniref:GNAT family N-acetyltransferase n=1 Tax=Streptomyces sp. NPDC093225 TaxID=3366034 RepID=UPI003813377D